MEIEEEFLDLPIDICRICRNSQSSLNILTEPLKDEHVLLHEALEFVTCLKVDSDDGMSLTMCQVCSSKLLEAYRFKNQVLDAYRSFHDKTSNLNIKREGSVDLDITSTGENNTKYQTEPEHTLVIERLDELDVDLTTDAVSFLLEHHNLKTRRKERLSIEEGNTQENDLPPKEFKIVKRNNCSPRRLKSIIKDHNPPDRTNTKYHDKSMKTGNIKFTCHICKKIFSKRSNLQDHLRLHANVKNFVCSFCQKAFVQVGNYRTHLRVHTKERPFHCHLCSKTYTQGGSLKIHIRSHTNEKNHVCGICNKGFTNKTDLGKHKIIHDPSKHFKCEFCNRLFSQQSNLKVHKLNVHIKKKQKKDKKS